MGLIESLPNGPVAIDSAIVIYLIERHERYLAEIRPLFEAANEGLLELVTSGITLLEVLVVPLRTSNSVLASRYEELLTRGRGLELVGIDRPILRLAAKLRAVHGIRAPDAIQMAAGLSRRCASFLTNDRRLPLIPDLPVVQLSDHLST